MTEYCRRGLSALKSLLAGRGDFYTAGSEIPNSPGTYVLVFHVLRELPVKTKYGKITLPPGCYAYVGSAYGPGGLRARVTRHWRKSKKTHWHIDWITTSDACKHVGAIVFEGQRSESEIAQTLAEALRPVPGFGASDSPEDTHLFRLP